MAKFKKIPVVIEAFQLPPLGGGASVELVEFLDSSEREILTDTGGGVLIQTLEGVMRGSPGDWIIKGVNGEYYPCKPDIFQKTYEPVVTYHASDCAVHNAPAFIPGPCDCEEEPNA